MSLFRHSLLVGDDLHVPGYRVATDPGAVGAGMLWEDLDTGTLRKRNLTNTGWVIIGGAASIYFNVADYGAVGDGSTDDTAAFKLAIAASIPNGNGVAPYGGVVMVPPGDYYLAGNPFADTLALFDVTGKGLSFYMPGVKLLMGRQLVVPGGVTIEGIKRRGSQIEAASGFVAQVNISTLTLTSDVVTVVTSSAHGLEVGMTVRLFLVPNAVFNGGWQVASVPSTTSFTFAMVPSTADTTSNSGTVNIPLVMLGYGTSTSRPHLRGVTVNPKGLTGSIAVYSNLINEPGSIRDLFVYDAAKYGVMIEHEGGTEQATGPMNYELTNLEVFLTPNVGAIGVHLQGQYASCRGLDHLTVSVTSGLAAGAIAAGLELKEVNGLFSRIHVEGTTNGILVTAASGVALDYSAGSVVLAGVTGQATVTTLVRIVNLPRVKEVVLMNIARTQGTTTLVHEELGNTLTDDFLAFYAAKGQTTETRFSTSNNVPWLVYPAATFRGGVTLDGKVAAQLATVTADGVSWDGIYHRRADATAGPLTITLPQVSANLGRVLTISKKDASGNAVTVTPYAGDTVNWAATYVLAARGNVVTIQADGTVNWDKVSAG